KRGRDSSASCAATEGSPTRCAAGRSACCRCPRRCPRSRPRSGCGRGSWRALALSSLALAVVLAVALLKPAPELPEGSLVVVLAGPDAKPALLASTARGSRYLTVAAIAPLTLAADRALELWMLPERGSPHSLGLVSAVAPGGMVRIALPAAAEQALQDIPALAVSLEPKGGSPTGLPTGPVLYSGPVKRLY